MDWHARMSARPSIQAATQLPTINYRRAGTP
jgi:hypothetical protein